MSTRGVPAAPRQTFRSYAASGFGDEVRRWEAYNAESLIALACEVRDTEPLRAKQTNLVLPRLQLATITGSPHHVSRSAELVERFPTDSIAVYVGLGADNRFTSNGHRGIIRRGDVIVCDADQPFERELGHGVSEFAVKVSRSELRESLGVEVPGEVSLLSARDNPAAHALTRTAVAAIRTAGSRSVDELGVLELVGLLAAGDATAPEVRHRAMARAHIEEHLADRDLSATTVAAATGISERQLSRIFAATGVSVPQYIRGRRLELARSILVAGSVHSTIDAARAAGFASPAHFSQAFQKRFGVSAGSVRRATGD